MRLFHPGKFFQEPVHIAVVEAGEAREIVYSPDLFTFGPKAAFARTLPDDLGFAGFRVMNPDLHGDWLAYLGASYFRSAGELQQYGLSARGLAVDTALSTPEEFPRFSHFYLEPGRDAVTVFALLESASLTGAYRFVWHNGKGVWGDVEARLFLRRSVARLGIAPLTSMYWFSETNRPMRRTGDPRSTTRTACHCDRSGRAVVAAAQQSTAGDDLDLPRPLAEGFRPSAA